MHRIAARTPPLPPGRVDRPAAAPPFRPLPLPRLFLYRDDELLGVLQD